MTAVQTAKPVPLASIGARNQQAPKGMPRALGAPDISGICLQ
jgi:hypothetical protein